MLPILYITYARIPTEKAHGLQIIRTIDALVEHGSKVTLVVPKRNNPIKETAEVFYGCRNKFPIVYLSLPFSWLEKTVPPLYFSLMRVGFGVRAFFYALVHPAPVVYTRDIFLAFTLSLATRKTVVYENHEPKKSKLWLLPFLLRHINKKVVVARGLISDYEGWGVSQDSYIFVPNGVSLHDLNNAKVDRTLWKTTFDLKESNFVALYIGHFYPWKGVYTLVDSVRYLKEGIVVVLIGGTVTENQKLTEYVDKSGLKNVFIRDFMPQNEVIRFMKSADVLILPNTGKEDRSSRYTTPIKLFEYLGSGVPIVASDIESLRWYLEDRKNALLCHPDDPKSLAEKILELKNNPELGKRLSNSAQTDAENYTWEKRAKTILNFVSSK